jgi:hypothetical protein
MVVRIRLSVGPQIVAQRKINARLALAFASLLTPIAVLSFVMALWGVLAHAEVTSKFVIEVGLLSHWQVWFAIGLLLQMASIALDRYGKRQILD